jgi:tRNA threonylcarbamoyladenosine biosynthesis protein TsaE
MIKKYLTKSFAQTRKLGESLAKKILKEKEKKTAFVLGLRGDLGGGKTTFLQGFARGLGVKQKILSPTFVIMKRFGTGKKSFADFYHIDCYRLQKPEEILEIGFRGIISAPKNIVAIEWPEKIKKFLPKDTLFISFEFIDKNKRKITIDFKK